MGVRVRFVESLHQIVEPVLEYLKVGAEGADIFEPQYVIVPTAGVRAWLTPQLARHLGAQKGRADGIVSNVNIGYVGMINALLRDGIEDEDDPWSIDRATMALLPVLAARPADDPLMNKHHGPLRAARAMADRFDRYAARRPAMIREWEDAYLSGGRVGGDNAVVQWQFDLWSAARHALGTPPWPARTRDLIAAMASGGVTGLPRRMMIAGLESLSAANLELVNAMSHSVDIELLCVHPSSRMATEWAASDPKVHVTPGRAPGRPDDDTVVPGAHVLPVTWMRGSRELQSLLVSQGMESPSTSDVWELRGPRLLGRVQSALRDPFTLTRDNHDADDHSVQIHLAHNLARQTEILRDALLHAFRELDDLHPDEIVILCADIGAAAPLLQAVFDQPIRLPDGSTLQIPLKVADRSLRDVDEGAELLASVLSLFGSRYDVSSVMRVASNGLVLRNLRMGEDEVETWLRYAEVTRIRWGLDVDQRRSAHFDVPTVTAHTWKQAIDRALLGALLPDSGKPVHELGGNVPLEGMDSSEIDALSGLAQVLDALSMVEERAVTKRPVADWCDEIENLLVGLCGSSCTEIDDSLSVVDHFRRAAGSEPAGTPVDFLEFTDLLAQRLSQAPGHQPLRTGAAVATSFVPLRSVPFRVVCVVGLDDGTLSTGESEGDDIAAAEPLMGDPDPRLDIRRVLMDAVLAAEDRLIFTCAGRSIKNNTKIPLVTPLAEFVDLCGVLGVSVHEDPEKLSGIEHQHPRHATGPLNFFPTSGTADHDRVPVEGLVWSHDPAAMSAGQQAGVPKAAAPTVHAAGQPKDRLQLRKLETLFFDPLDYYLRESLRIYREYEQPDAGAVLPVSAKKSEVAKAARKLIEQVGGRRAWPRSPKPDPMESSDEKALRDAWLATVAEWKTSLDASDLLPVGEFGRRAADEAERVATAVWGAALAEGVPSVAPAVVEGEIDLGALPTVEFGLVNVVEDADTPFVYSVRFDHYVEGEKARLKLALLVLRAWGKSNVTQAKVIYRNAKSEDAVVEIMELDSSVTTADALSRLAALVAVEPIARTVPCARFGDTSAHLLSAGKRDHPDVIASFRKFVGNDYQYPGSVECQVFGADPAIADAYPKKPKLQIDVFTALDSLFSEDDPSTDGSDDGGDGSSQPGTKRKKSRKKSSQRTVQVLK